jgi:hypothetical protein
MTPVESEESTSVFVFCGPELGNQGTEPMHYCVKIKDPEAQPWN